MNSTDFHPEALFKLQCIFIAFFWVDFADETDRHSGIRCFYSTLVENRENYVANVIL